MQLLQQQMPRCTETSLCNGHVNNALNLKYKDSQLSITDHVLMNNNYNTAIAATGDKMAMLTRCKNCN